MSTDPNIAGPADTSQPDATDTLVWRVVPGRVLAWREWDDGCAIFNRLTGETHFLDLTSAYLLRLLEAERRTVPALAAQMAQDLGRALDEVLTRQVARTLSNFQSMGVVETAA